MSFVEDKNRAFWMGLAIFIFIFISSIIIVFGIVLHSDSEEKQIECIWVENNAGMIVFDNYTIDYHDTNNHLEYTFRMNENIVALLRGDMETKIKEDNYCYEFKLEPLHYPYNENGTWVWR